MPPAFNAHSTRRPFGQADARMASFRGHHMALVPKRNGVVNWILGVVVVAGIIGVFGVSFTNRSTLAAHQQAERAHPVIAVQLEAIARDVEHIRIKVDEIDRWQRGAP